MFARRSILWIAGLLVVAALVIPALALTEPTDAPAAALLVEAEEFQPVAKSAWRRIPVGENYYWATLANTFISHQKLLSAPPQCPATTASITVTIPRAGAYRVWTRYELPSRWSAEHTLRITQGGRKRLDRVYGRLQSPKLWPFSQGVKPMVEWPWGSGDNIVWECSDPLELRQGKATLTLVAGPQPGEALPACHGAARRNVDCVLLTTDLEEGLRDAKKTTYPQLDHHLNQRGGLWIRVANPRNGPAPLWLALDVKEHNPYWQKRHPAPAIGARGALAGKPEEADWLEPGRSTPWVAVGQALDSTNWQELMVAAHYRAEGGTATPPGTGPVIEFAHDAAGKQPLSRITLREGAGAKAVFEIPADGRAAKSIRTLEAMQRELLTDLQRLPLRGKMPRRLPVYGVVGGAWPGPSAEPDVLARLRTETGLLLGRNTWAPGEVPEDLVRRYGVTVAQNLLIDVRNTPTERLEAELRGHPFRERIGIVSMGDEIQVGGYDPASVADQQGFREYLERLRALSPEEREREFAVSEAVPAPDAVRLTRDAGDGRSYYWSQLFGIDRGIEPMKERTAIVQRVLGPDVATGANYSPHPHYWPKVGPWVRVFRRGGLTMPWTEDWSFQVPTLSPQIIAYVMDVCRCAAKYRGGPIQCYTMPHFPGQTARDLTLSFSSALAHGNRVLNFFAAMPVYEYTENYITWEGRANWRAVRDLVHDAGMADDLLAGGHVRPARVAMLLSHATDIYEEARGSSVYNFERQNLYFALRHAQVAVDFVTEEDVVEGWLDGQDGHGQGYRTLYVCGDHMLRSCAAKLRQWVRGGGRLVSVAGGGFKDGYDQPLELLGEVYGVEHQTLSLTEKNIWAKEGLAWAPRLDTIRTSSGLVFPALLARQDLVTGVGAHIVARFADGKPAGVSHRFGAGTAELWGTFPGSAYIQPAIPKRPYDRGASDTNFNHFLPTSFDTHLRDLITKGLAAESRPVVCSEPLIDATVIEAPDGLVVPLANYRGKPLKATTVTIRDVPAFKSIESVRSGPLASRRRGRDVTVRLPLGWADMVVVRERG
jgi:hypothetical protein